MSEYTEIIEYDYDNLSLTLKEPYEIPIALNPTIKHKIYKTKTLGWSLNISKEDFMSDDCIYEHKRYLQSEILNEMKKFIVFKTIPQDFYTVLIASFNIGVNNETEEQIKNLRDSLEKSYREQRHLEHKNSYYEIKMRELIDENIKLEQNNTKLNLTIFNYKFGIWIFFLLFVLIVSFILVCVR